MDESEDVLRSRESVGLIKNGLLRIVSGGTVGIVLMEVFDAGWLSYAGVGLAFALGVVLVFGAPVFLTRPFTRTVLDVLAVSFVVIGVGGVENPLSLLYFVAAFGVVWIRSNSLAAIAALTVLAGFIGSALLTGSLNMMDIPVYVAILSAFCAISWSVAGEIDSLRFQKDEAEEALDAERSYSGAVSEFALDFGSILRVLDLRGILGWTSRTTLDLTSATYSHVVLLDGNQHSTSTKGDAEVLPTWWHPSLQEMVLKASRAGEPLVDIEKVVHGIKGFAAVPLEVQGSEHNGTIIVGGGEFGEHELKVMRLIAAQITSSLAGAADAPGGRDPISGLPNRVSLFHTLESELANSGRVTLVSVHISGMWHPERDRQMRAGERLLKEISGALSERQRTYRYDSDEFYILIRGSNTRRAERISAWVRDLIHRLSDSTPLTPRVSISYLMSEAGEGAGSLLVRAEQYLSDMRGLDSAGDYSLPTDVLEGDSPEERDAVRSLLKAASIRDPELAVHLASVRRLSRIVGETMGLSSREMKLLSTGALLHDIGKIGVPDAILKKPGRLTSEEFDVIKSHTIMGASVLAQVPGLSEVVPIVRHHHERYDGRGYPDGVVGKDIPLPSRIVFVVDAYDSMVKDRAYRRGLTHEEALSEISANAGTQFDPAIAATFLRIMEYEGDISSGRGLSAI